jgi:hypothetical protein
VRNDGRRSHNLPDLARHGRAEILLAQQRKLDVPDYTSLAITVVTTT